MNIMFNISSLAKGGAERVVANLSNAFIEENDVEILVNTKKDIAYELQPKIKVLELDKKRDNNVILRNIKRLILTQKYIKEIKPDIIISFLPMPSYRVLMLRNINKIPIIISDRNDPKEEYKTFINKILMKTLYKRADGFVFQTKQQKEYFSKEIQNKSCIIPNPIKDEFLHDDEQIEKEKTIICVGRLVEQKNHEILIDAFKEIYSEYPEYQLKIFGEGILREKLQKKINSIELQDAISLCGVSNDIKHELLKSEIFVLPSNYEGMPNALLEAMAVGLPCISTDCPCGGPKELIQNNENGLLIAVNNKKELVKSLKTLLDNKEKAFLIGNNAKKIKDSLNAKNISNIWKEYIENITRSFE